jgi:hypothetical protein
MRTSRALTIAVGTLIGLGLFPDLPVEPQPSAWGQSGGRETPKRTRFRMTEAIVCRSIEGYEDYEPLPGAAMTADEKLLIYYRPINYRSDLVKGYYQAHFTQDGEIRKKGAKTAIRQKLKVLDYTTPKMEQPPQLIYLRNTISLKGLEPGEYDFVIILRDEVGKGPPARQVVRFRVIPASGPQNPEAEKGESPGNGESATKKVSPKATSANTKASSPDSDPAAPLQ